MGISLFGNSFKGSKEKYSYGYNENNEVIKLPNPVPNNFSIVKKLNIGRWVVVKINYPDCVNYEGNKIIVYDDIKKFEKCINKKFLDPHFCNDDSSPIARFEPTRKGWKLAEEFVKFTVYNNKKSE